jgi:hypothetical protein
MTTNTKNLEAAASHWDRQAVLCGDNVTYVVVTQNANRVLADNMAVMLAGACTPEEFTSHSIAIAHAANLNNTVWDFDRAEQFQTMTYKGLCMVLAERFRAAIQAARLADSLALTPVAA